MLVYQHGLHDTTVTQLRLVVFLDNSDFLVLIVTGIEGSVGVSHIKLANQQIIKTISNIKTNRPILTQHIFEFSDPPQAFNCSSLSS
jgi:hypothetical protein